MARKVKKAGTTKTAKKPTAPKIARRLPSGQYGWKGRAIPFAKLPKAEKSRLRSGWAGKAAKTRKVERTIAERPRAATSQDRKKAREWIERRTKKLGEKAGDAKEILTRLGPKAVLAARELQRAAHAAYAGRQSKPGGRAREIANQIRENLGEELAAIMPQLWWYH